MSYAVSGLTGELGGELAEGVVRLLAPAKLTLSLRITGARADAYHTIDATMVTLDLCDELILSPGDGLTVIAAGALAGGVPVGNDNLVRAALRLVGRRAQVQLRKRIPVGGGLGGGSADAAAVLRWANAESGDGVQAVSIAEACRLGADVGFCLAGGRARVQGIGEIVRALAYVPEQYTLLTPPFGVSSAAVYQAWDRLGTSTSSSAATSTNDLETAALAVAPELAHWRDALGDQTGLHPNLAGSGSTWFVKGHHCAVSYEGVAALPVTTTRPTPTCVT